MPSDSTTPPRPTGYPSWLERRHRLPAGEEIFIRPILPADAALIRVALDQADPDTLYRRFFTPDPGLSEAALRRLSEVDYRTRCAVVAFALDQPIGIARYEGSVGSTTAEVAVVVHPDWRRRGVATALASTLSDAARRNGLRSLRADYLADNRPVGRALARFGFDVGRPERGVVSATRSLD